MLGEGAFVQLGTSEERGYDDVFQKIACHPYKCSSDLAELEGSPGLQLFVEDADRVVFIGFQKTLQHGPTHVFGVFLLDLL